MKSDNKIEVVTKKEARRRIKNHNSFVEEMPILNDDFTKVTHIEVRLCGARERLNGSCGSGMQLSKFRYKLNTKRKPKKNGRARINKNKHVVIN